MKNKISLILFLLVCVILAILLLIKAITFITSGAVFAAALVIFGLMINSSINTEQANGK